MDRLEQAIESNKRAVDEYVLRLLPERHETKEVRLLYSMMRDYPLRPSKGLRPSMCILTCQALGGHLEDALATAAALELFQNWILIHDDVEDCSLMRRGQPVLHLKYSVPLSINAGDALHGRTWGAVLDNERLLGVEKTLLLAKEFRRMTDETTEGQHIELSWIHQNKWDLKEEDYYALVRKKTAWYTCVSPCRMGAVIANADKKIIKDLIPFGLDLGVAFQITDDLLNLVGDEKKYGKELGGDIAEGKRTLMLIRLLNTCSPEDRVRVLKIVGKPRGGKTQDNIESVIDMMTNYGVLEYAKEKASSFASRARRKYQEIFGSAPNKKAVETLSRLIDFMVERQW